MQGECNWRPPTLAGMTWPAWLAWMRLTRTSDPEGSGAFCEGGVLVPGEPGDGWAADALLLRPLSASSRFLLDSCFAAAPGLSMNLWSLAWRSGSIPSLQGNGWL